MLNEINEMIIEYNTKKDDHDDDDHEAIIPKDIFLRVQEEMARRSTENSRKRRFSSNHAFSQIVFCSECEEIYKRLHWNNRGSKYIVWRCSSHLHEKKTCNSRTVREDVLQDRRSSRDALFVRSAHAEGLHFFLCCCIAFLRLRRYFYDIHRFTSIRL